MLLAPQTVGLLVQFKIAGFGRGTWCSGITPAQHAGGPGFNPRCVHSACHAAAAWPRLSFAYPRVFVPAHAHARHLLRRARDWAFRVLK